jgi:hypothetical protein
MKICESEGLLITHKGQSSFDIRFPKADIREVALTTHPTFKARPLSDCFTTR